MEITINENLVPVLEKQAVGNNKTKEEMAEHIIEKYLIREYKEEIKNKIDGETIENIKQIDVVINSKIVELHPVAVVEDPLMEMPPEK